MPRLISENAVLKAKKLGRQTVIIEQNTIITPLAREAAAHHGIQFELASAQEDQTHQSAPLPPPQFKKSALAIGSDHGGFEMKQILIDFLQSKSFQVEDVGCYSADSVDYPDIAQAVAEKVAQGQTQAGIIVDGVGVGSAMAANKVPGVRAACCNDLFSAANSREHNGANVLTLGGRLIGDELAKKIVMTWLYTDFGGGRHAKRVAKIDQIDLKYKKSR